MKRVYCLYRVSTLIQVEKDDIPMQKQACHEFAERQGWEIVKEFSEKGVSGFKVAAKDRDAIQEILKAATEKKFDVLLVFMFDRIGRREYETAAVVQSLSDSGIEVWSTQEGEQRFDSHVDSLMNFIRYWQAQGESIKTSVRTKTRMGQIVREGHYRGGTVPYGYQLVKRGRFNKRGAEVCDIEVCPHEAEIVKMIYNKYVYEGFGVNRLNSYLADNGIFNHHGRRFSFSSMRCIIQNPIYIGILKSGETLSEPFPELQIVDNEIFDMAQRLRTERTNEYEEKRKLPMNTKGKALLSGNIFCAHCGGRLDLTTSVKSYSRVDGSVERIKRIKYVCYNKTRKICACDGQSSYTTKRLDDIITTLLMNLFNNIKGVPEKELIDKSYKKELAGCNAKLKSARAELKKQSDSLKSLQDEVVGAIQGTSKFDAGLLNDLIKQTRERVDASAKEVQGYEAELENQQQRIDAIQTNYKNLVGWSEIFQDSNMETKKMITAYLIDSVKVNRNYAVEVKFNLAYEQFCAVN